MDFMNAEPILLPIVTLVIWTLVMQGWMIIARIPAMQQAGLGPQSAERTADLAKQMPKAVQWKADNYNHLMEQPTIFYATALALAVANLGDGLHLWLAWIYVATRIAHSLVHATINKVMLRLTLFAIGSLALLVMAVSGVIQLV